MDDRRKVIFEAARACARVGVRFARSNRLRLDDPPEPAEAGRGGGEQTQQHALEAWALGMLQPIAVPLVAAAGALVAAVAGRAALPWAWPLAAVAGGGLAWLVWRRAPRGPERSVGLPALVAGVAAVTVTWAAGRSPATAIGAVVLTVAWSVLWVAYGPAIRRAEVAVTPAVPAVLARWGEHLSNLGLGGTEARVAHQDADVVRLEVRLPSGRAVRDLAAIVERLESALARDLEPAARLRPGGMRVEKDLGRAHVAHLFIELGQPQAVQRAFPEPVSHAFREPVIVGHERDGTAVGVTVAGRHAMVAGRTGSGKSHELAALILGLARRDTLLLGIDVVDSGANLGPVGAVFHRLAATAVEAAELVEAVQRIREARTAWMAAHGLREWPVSPERPQTVLVIDEVTGLIRALGGVEGLNALVAEGRKAGISLLMTTQRMNAEALGGSTGLASQCHVLICLRVTKRREGAAVFGDDRVAEGWWPDRLAEKGEMLVWSDGEREVPTPVGAYWLTTDEARRLAAIRAAQMPGPDPETAAALAPRVQAPAPPADPQETAEELLRRLLVAAGDAGARFGELVAAVAELPAERRRSRAWVGDWLRKHARDAGHGRWRLPAEGGRP